MNPSIGPFRQNQKELRHRVRLRIAAPVFVQPQTPRSSNGSQPDVANDMGRELARMRAMNDKLHTRMDKQNNTGNRGGGNNCGGEGGNGNGHMNGGGKNQDRGEKRNHDDRHSNYKGGNNDRNSGRNEDRNNILKKRR